MNPQRASGILAVTACVLALLLPAAAAAQRAGPTEFWRALEASQSPEAVAAVPAPAELDPQVARALRLLREYELDPVRSTAYRARQDLQRLVQRRPREAWHHLALGLVLRRGPDAHTRTGEQKAEYHFVDPWSLASANSLRALRRALQLDPSLEIAAIELASYAVERHDAALLGEADGALRRVTQTGEVLLARAAIALKRDDRAAALELAAAAAAAGGDPGRAAHMRAVALLRDGARDSAGAAIYLHGLGNPSRAALAEYHRAAAPVLFRHEVARWDSLPYEARAAWLREMWELRAALAGVSLGERLGVHFRRLHQAQTEYPLTRPLADAEMYGGAAILTGEELRRHGLTPPGLMLVRNGDPAWLRWLGVCGTAQIPYMPDMQQRTRTGPRLPTAGVLDRLLPPGQRRPVDSVDILHAEDRDRIRRVDCANPSSLLAFTRYIADGDRYRPHFDAPLPALADLWAFRGDHGADVYAALTLERRHVAAIAGTDGAAAMHAALTFADTAARRTSRSETTLHFAVPGEHAAHVLLVLPANTALDGNVEVRVAIGDERRRLGAVLGFTHRIPDFGTGQLEMSDVVIAPTDAADRLRRGSISLGVAAARTYRRGEPFHLFYEVYGLAADARYSTRIVLAPHESTLWRTVRQITGREPDAVALQFEETAGTPHRVFGVQQLRTIETTDLRPGTYRLRVEITDPASGQAAFRERLLDIR